MLRLRPRKSIVSVLTANASLLTPLLAARTTSARNFAGTASAKACTWAVSSGTTWRRYVRGSLIAFEHGLVEMIRSASTAAKTTVTRR